MRIRMTKEVLVTISGLQFSPETESESVELITSGSYYKKNGKHYIIYDEVNEGFSETTRNIIKLNDDFMDITRRGVSNVHMMFEEKPEECDLLLYAVWKPSDRDRRKKCGCAGDRK